MKNSWYGDDRDLIKWGALLHLAGDYNIHRILQVAYLRPDDKVSLISSKLGVRQVAPEVLLHFRDIRHIKRLEVQTHVQIEVFDKLFLARAREVYKNQVIDRVRELRGVPKIVFLDPDTGIARKKATLAHVSPKEVSAIWAELRPGDWLAIYQHSQREINWVNKQCAIFSAACSEASVIRFRSKNKPRNMAIFAATRSVGLPQSHRKHP